MEYSLDEQIACLERELRLRRACYPKWIESKKMSPQKADKEIGALTAALNTLKELRDNERQTLHLR